MRHGGKILVDQLALQGVTTLFTVPGESFLAVLDGLHDSPAIRTIVCRQEGGAAMMAQAYGKQTNHPGICFVTRGPGATNAMAGLHVARQGSTPLILFVGLPARTVTDREPFQDIDLQSLCAPVAKHVAIINDTTRIPEYISAAFHRACSGRPGPVVLGLPQDMLFETANVANARPAQIASPAPLAADLIKLRQLFAKAKRPMMLVGGPGWSRTTQLAVEDFATRFDLPVACSFRCQDYINNAHECYVGHAGLSPHSALTTALKAADLLIAFGPRLGEITSQDYAIIDIPNPADRAKRLVHIHVNADELGAIYCPELAINADATSFANALTQLALPLQLTSAPATEQSTRSPPQKSGFPWSQWRQQLRAALTDSWTPLPTPGAVKLEEVLTILAQELPSDAILTNGAGNYAAFAHRYFLYRGYGTQLAPQSGSMGYGLPAAIAAQLIAPARTVVALAGDGCFMMTVQELATAVQYELPILIIVVNNAMYGTIRMHQEQHYPGRAIATSLQNPDFAALARSFGVSGQAVTETEQFRPALKRALAIAASTSRPALIELQTDPRALTPNHLACKSLPLRQ